MINVHRADESDWLVLKGARLRALELDADAFGLTLEQEEAQPEKFWRERLTTEAWFLAWAGEEVAGVAAMVLPARMSDERQLDAMWVVPAWRGQGVGEALIQAVAALARGQGAMSLSLTVADGCDHARRLYERVGFRSVGEREPRPRNPQQMRERLCLSLGS